MSGRFLDVTATEYHADPCEVPSLSHSIAVEMLRHSPLHAWQMHPRLGGSRRVPTGEMNNGTLIHALLLGKGEDEIAVLDVPNFKTKAAQEARDGAIAAGKCPIKTADYEEAKGVAKTLKERLADLTPPIVLDGLSEQKLEWTEQTHEDGEVLCRGMIDHLKVRFSRATEMTVYDIKTISSADKKTIQKHVLDYGYDVQEAAYRSAVGNVSPEALGRIQVVFLFCETEAPYAVTPIELDGMFRTQGQIKWEHAVRTWARCLKEKKWPAYTDRIIQVEPPPWALTG